MLRDADLDPDSKLIIQSVCPQYFSRLNSYTGTSVSPTTKASSPRRMGIYGTLFNSRGLGYRPDIL